MDGTVLLSGHVAYVAQEPWIMNTTIKDNILFGERFDTDRYYRVLYVCALNKDVNEFKVVFKNNAERVFGFCIRKLSSMLSLKGLNIIRILWQ